MKQAGKCNGSNGKWKMAMKNKIVNTMEAMENRKWQ
jgi:hypothetical protein